jgi:hypothetical protein
MTASTSRRAATDRYRVPEVYFEPQPRAPEGPAVRTDVAGFIGFERQEGTAARLLRCDDWNDFRLTFGEPRDDGTLLAPAVRAFFANGGSRCYVVTVRRPDFHDPAGLDQALRDLVGVQGSSEAEATGLERLLLVEEVSIIDVPDLYARRVEAKPEMVRLGPRAEETRFIPCTKVLGPAGPVQVSGERRAFEPLFTEQKVRQTQQNLLRRCIPERWRVLLLLSPPWPATLESAFSWRDHFDRLVKLQGFAETEEMACAALYFPWVLAQERVDAPVVELPPTPFVAGIIARRDLARGPHVAPANETLRGVVALTVALDDNLHGRLYSPDPDAQGLAVPAINVLRAFPGFGMQVWGARTLSTEKWLRYLPVRRCLSAIERRVKAALDPVVFEPNTPLLWLQVTHLILGVLLPVFDSGALRGERPEHAFYVRCDASINPPEEVQAGRLVCEVGVAVAAPAEFLVFRLGRREGVVEVIE